MNLVMRILQIIVASLFLQSTIAIAAFNASSCDVVISMPDEVGGYLKGSTVYGYLKELINVRNCNETEQITICVFNPDNTSPDQCDSATLAINANGFLTEIFPKNPIFTQDASIKNLRFSVQKVSDNICLMLPTVYGLKPVACNNASNLPDPVNDKPVEEDDEVCKRASEACIGINASQSVFNFSGGAVQCVEETLSSIFFNTNKCGENEESFLTSLKQFSVFQESLHKAVTALLILYVMGFGIKILLDGGKVTLDSIVGFVIKFVLVSYFSIGLGPFYYNKDSGQVTVHNGMIDWGLPILTQVTRDFAQMAFNAGGSRNLCSFDITKYPRGSEGYALWDVVDCKLGAYLGIKSIYNLGNIKSSRSFTETRVIPPAVPTISMNSQFNPDNSATSELGVFCVLFLLMIGGGFLIVIALMYYLLIFFSFVFGFISLFAICMITLYLLVYLAPIFVPMALFQRTKGYFDSYLKALIGCTLQPMVIAGFTAVIMILYDSILYGSCEFVIHEYQSVYNLTYRTFEMVIPSRDVTGCISTPGYILLAYILGAGSDQHNYIFFQIDYIRDIYNLVGQSLILMVLSTVFYYFSRSLYQFAADLTGGIDASGVAISPSRIVDKVRGAINFAILVARAALKDPSAKKELEQKVKEEVQSAAPKAPGGDGGSAPKAPGSPAPRGGIGK